MHNRYRSAAPSGENRVVDQEGEALVAQGHEVVRFERYSDDIEHFSSAQKTALPFRVIWSRESHRSLAAVLREHQPDVVHVHNTFPLLSAAVLYSCREARVPVVATIHNYRLACASGDYFRDGVVCHDCAAGNPAPALVHGCYRSSRLATAPMVLATAAHRRAWRSLVSAYVFISASERDLLGGLGLDEDRMFVRHNLVPWRPCRREAPREAVLFAGRLDEAKGVRVMMDGWDRYRATAGATPLHLVIAGSGPLEREVAAWASSRPSVEWLGQVDRERCFELMSGARAVLLPSAWEETFGLVVVEAMATGTAPIATSHGSFAELISPGLDGELFPPGDPAALAAILTDVEARPDHYRQLGDQARNTYEERFDPDQSIARLLEIYRYAMAHPAC
jgi:glycosyltransferase involved in cell wall biosynthesis